MQPLPHRGHVQPPYERMRARWLAFEARLNLFPSTQPSWVVEGAASSLPWAWAKEGF